MLEVGGLEAGYGEGRVLFGVDLAVGAGEVVTLLGRNGMGKTTTIAAIMGMLPNKQGIAFDGADICGETPDAIARRGIGLVPEGRIVFPTLTVRENLLATARGTGWSLETVVALFPPLASRSDNLGSQLSGGEQQMLAIGRALMTNPRLLILDEATEGLAPLVRAEIWRVIARLKREGLSILVVDKNLRALLRLADRLVILEKGRVVWTGASPALAADEAMQHRFLGV